MTVRFVVISEARSGSTMLRGTLTTHRDIIMHGEILGARRVRSLVRPPRSPEAQLSEDDFAQRMLDLRRRDAGEFLERHVYASTLPAQAVGFKLLLEQGLSLEVAEIVEHLQAMDGLKVVYLQRVNKLARYASEILHRQGITHIRAGDQRPDQRTVEVDPDLFAQDCRNQEAAMRLFRRLFAGRESLDLTYEALAGDPVGSFREAFGFLGVAPDVEAKIGTAKINSSRLDDVISNLPAIAGHAAVRPFLEPEAA